MTRLKIRYLTRDDIPFADSLRAIEGWNQTATDWQRFIDLSPQGCLLAECGGQPVATATTICYGTEVGWIGMMLVHPDFRRRGIARVLLKHCIELLRNSGVRSIQLDATPIGREVYLKMGFRDQFNLTRYKGENLAPAAPNESIRPATPDDLERISALDQAAIGAPREELLRRLISESISAVVYCPGNEVIGFGILRSGSIAAYLGPVVASDPKRAEQIASALLNRKLFCDLSDQNEPAARWAKSRGLAPQRNLTRMYLGENIQPKAPCSYFAIASPDLG